MYQNLEDGLDFDEAFDSDEFLVAVYFVSTDFVDAINDISESIESGTSYVDAFELYADTLDDAVTEAAADLAEFEILKKQ